MAQVEVRDRSIWTKHIHGDAQLVRELEELNAGQTVRLKVHGRIGVWEKMRDAPGGVSTPGLKPVGDAGREWGKLFMEQRGSLVELSRADAVAERWQDASDAERDAAWEAFKALTKAGWVAERAASRDDLHER